MEFCDYIQSMWADIGYTPQEVEIASLYDDLGDSEDVGLAHPLPQQIGGGFTPVKVQSHGDLFGGVMIKNIPRGTNVTSILEFLFSQGLPENMSECVEVKENGKVYIQNIDNSLCLSLVKKLHQAKFSDKTLMCNELFLQPQ